MNEDKSKKKLSAISQGKNVVVGTQHRCVRLLPKLKPNKNPINLRHKMAQYPLTAQQKKLLTALKSGFENKTIPDRVLMTRVRNGMTIRYLNAKDVPLPKTWESVVSADLIAFLRWGFMATRDEKTYTFDERLILEAINNKFTIPDPAASKAKIGAQQPVATPAIVQTTRRVAIDLPDDIYERIEQEAKRQQKTIEAILADTLVSIFGKK